MGPGEPVQRRSTKLVRFAAGTRRADLSPTDPKPGSGELESHMKKHLAIAALATAGAVLVAPAALAAPTAPAPTSAGTTTVSAPAPVGPETTISGPQTAKVGQEFKITGKTDKGLKGSKVYAYQDGKKIAAERTVAANGDISMRIVSGKAGANQAYQFRVVDGAKNVWRSNTIHINVVK